MDTERIHFLVELGINDGALAEFKSIAQSMIEGVWQEPGTLQYEWYLSSDETSCRVLETYADAAAVNAHLNGRVVQELAPGLFRLTKIVRFEVYGEPDAEAAAVLKAVGAEILPHWNGLGRAAGASIIPC